MSAGTWLALAAGGAAVWIVTELAQRAVSPAAAVILGLLVGVLVTLLVAGGCEVLRRRRSGKQF